MGKKTYFLGWKNIKYGITEFLKIFSSKPSFFSKKRLESSFAFAVGQFGMIYFLMKNITTMETSDIVMWAVLEFTVAGYMVHQIQKQKQINNVAKSDDEEPDKDQ